MCAVSGNDDLPTHQATGWMNPAFPGYSGVNNSRRETTTVISANAAETDHSMPIEPGLLTSPKDVRQASVLLSRKLYSALLQRCRGV